MTLAAELLKGAKLDPQYQDIADCADIHDQLGFMVEQLPVSPLTAGRVAVIAFANGGWQEGQLTNPKYLHSVTDFDQLDPSTQTLSHQNRGTGWRGYSTQQALRGAAEDVSEVGVYRFLVDPRRILYRTGRNDLHMKARYARLQMRARAYGVAQYSEEAGLREVITSVNRKIGDVDAVVYDQTVRGARLQKERKQPELPGAVGRLLIVRKSGITIRRIGTLTR